MIKNITSDPLNLKNLTFDPDKDEYYKNTTKEKLRKLRYLNSKRQAKKLKKLLDSRKLNKSRDVINQNNISKINSYLNNRSQLRCGAQVVIHRVQCNMSNSQIFYDENFVKKKKIFTEEKKILKKIFILLVVN